MGGVVDDTEKWYLNDAYELHSFSFNIKHDRITGSPFAINMNSKIIQNMVQNPDSCITLDQFMPRFTEFLESAGYERESRSNKFHLILGGKNVGSFDINFLRRIPGWFENISTSSRFVDPVMLYFDVTDDQLPDLKTCKERAGIEGDVAHYGLEDAMDCLLLVRKALRQKPFSSRFSHIKFLDEPVVHPSGEPLGKAVYTNFSSFTELTHFCAEKKLTPMLVTQEMYGPCILSGYPEGPLPEKDDYSCPSDPMFPGIDKDRVHGCFNDDVDHTIVAG